MLYFISADADVPEMQTGSEGDKVAFLTKILEFATKIVPFVMKFIEARKKAAEERKNGKGNENGNPANDDDIETSTSNGDNVYLSGGDVFEKPEKSKGLLAFLEAIFFIS